MSINLFESYDQNLSPVSEIAKVKENCYNGVNINVSFARLSKLMISDGCLISTDCIEEMYLAKSWVEDYIIASYFERKQSPESPNCYWHSTPFNHLICTLYFPWPSLQQCRKVGNAVCKNSVPTEVSNSILRNEYKVAYFLTSNKENGHKFYHFIFIY